MTDAIGVLGEGRIADAIRGLRGVLDGEWEGALIVAGDTADLDLTEGPGIAWLPVRVELGTAIIGPAVTPGTPGCPACAATRRTRAREDSALRAEARKRYPERYAAPTPWLAAPAVDTVARLAVAEAGELLSGAPGRTSGAEIHVRLDTLSSAVHRFLPDPACPECGGLPDDSRRDARIELRPQPKIQPGRHRVRDLFAEEDSLMETYVDSEVGMIRAVRSNYLNVYPSALAPMGLPGEEGESGFGRDLNFRAAKLTSVAEAVERYGGVRPHGRRTVVHGSRRSLGEDTVDPRTFGLYPDDRYEVPGFPYRRYDDDLEFNWVWGYSFARGGPVLVPESYAYYRMHDGSNFVYEISNGCAVGGCLEEAILHGVLELAERDAFLMTWYARLPARRLDLNSAADRRLPLMAERIRHETGFEVHAFDTTMEHGIPSSWVMAVHPSPGPDTPKALCAAGSAFDPERAVANGLLELAPMVRWRLDTYPAERERAAAMVDDPGLVRTMHDHSLVYCHPAAFDRLEFLLGGAEHSIAESYRDSFRPDDDDLTRDLTATVERLAMHGLDVIVVDQTSAEHRAGGFACVKTIVPGLLPMTFGYWARRVDGLHRLAGFEVNPHPHPFP
ncbi:TOMM precursor leader peptide-binding protein [Streptosporangium sp. NPDC051023]|uniref:TOMM precursor leader peptide-binding protein n=1 Tax=Streptosporangium sp. NPDC051023 TaxID=3155410 RepID=UPI003450EF3B